MTKSKEIEKQLSLPGFENLPPETFNPPKRRPRKPETYNLEISLHYLAHSHYNAPFQRRIAGWLNKLEFPLEEILTDTQKELVELFYQEWFTLREIAAQKGCRPKAVKKALKPLFLKIRRRQIFGPNAIEVLKLPRTLYSRLHREEIFTIEQIFSLDDDQLRQACASPSSFEKLKQALVNIRGREWERKLEFPILQIQPTPQTPNHLQFPNSA